MDSEWQSYHDWLSRGGMFDDPDQWIFSAFSLHDSAIASSASDIETIFPGLDLGPPERESPSDPPPSAIASGPKQPSQVDPVALPNDPTSDTESAPQHAWTQTSQATTTKALNHLVLEVSENNVTTFFCGWEGCKHPVGFVSKAQLITHIRSMHLQEKPFKCTKCGTSFTRKQEAIRHVNTMNGGKRYRCSVCQQAFFRKHSRDNHEDHCMSQDQGAGPVPASSDDTSL